MKTIILTLISILSLGAYGQGINRSLNGLEGWGKGGVIIVAEDYSNRDKSFNVKAIKTKVELKLRLAGIEVAKEGEFTTFPLFVSAQPYYLADGTVTGYALRIRPGREVLFLHGGKTYKTIFCCLKSYSGTVGKNNLLKAIDQSMDSLLVDYLKANPKKE